jgi:predicted phage-related endonuclease
MQRDPNIHREIHELVQGTPEWDAYRVEHDNASDAPAMMSCSPYKTRSDLIRQCASGISPEVDARTQKLFDDGHRYEALARPLAEKIIGMELYPVIASLGRLSASFDGLTMCETVVWEHKSLNNDIRACDSAAGLPLVYRVQMEQQLHIVSAERALFSATRWDAYDNLVEEKHFWYEPDLVLRQQIIGGWEQFHADVASYTPAASEVTHVAAPAITLPALVIQTRGEVTQSNLPAFKAAAELFLAGIKTTLETDEDFIDADQAVKDCEKAERDIEHAKTAATAQMATVDDVLRVADQVKEMIRARRLTLSKLIDNEKLNRKETIINEGKRNFEAHVAQLETEIAPIRLAHQVPDFAGAAKGKRTIKGLQDAVDAALASGKVATSQTATELRAKLTWYNANVGEHAGLFADLQQLIGKAQEDFQLVANTRIEKKKAEELAKAEALRKQIEEQERAKAETAAAEKLAAERKADADRQATEQARVAAETKRQLEAQAAHLAAQRQADEQRTQQAAQTERPTTAAAAIAQATALADQARLTDLADAQAAAAAPGPVGDLFSTPAAAPDAPPTLKLGQINERIAPMAITVDGLRALGFEPAATDRASKLYHDADFPRMCAAMMRHIGAAQAKFAA